jgi:hypothetical protein
MKATELRINNLVNAVMTNEVYSIDLWALNVIEEGNYQNSHNTKTKVFKPIPLTEEWLLKLGFKSDDISWEYSKRLGNFYIMYDIEINSIYINDGSRYDGADIPNEIKHVHQLQNLYFALTGQELTLNN